MPLISQVSQTGLAEPGLDNYECPLRRILAHREKECGSAELTRYEVDEDGEYTLYTVKGIIEAQGSNIDGLPIGNYAKYAHTLFCPDVVREGDEIEDAYGNLYAVMHAYQYWWLDRFSHYVCELLKLQTVTHYKRLSSSAYTYATSDIALNMAVRGQSTINPQEYYGIYDYVGVTASQVYEGDRILDSGGSVYEVMQAVKYPTSRNDIVFNWTVCVLVKQFPAATLKTLTLGATPDATTGHYPYTFTESTVYAQIFNPAKTTIKTALGYYGKYSYVMLTSTAVYESDQIVVDGVTYEVQQVTNYKADRVDIALKWYVCGLIKRDFTNSPASSGTWHLDSTSAKTDPRYRQKLLIDAYLTAANIKKDDGLTDASTLTCFDGAYYDIKRLFLIKALDAVAVISRGVTNTLYTSWVFGHKPYGFEEQVKIECTASNKSTITGTNLAEKYEQEIRRIYTTYDAYTNVRDIDTIEPAKEDLGYTYLYKTAVNIKYKRINDAYTPTYPTITWGPSTSATGTYVWPNVTKFGYVDPDTGDIRILPPGRMGDLLQILGSEDFEIVLVSDLSLEPAGKTWKRAQTSAKTDDCPWEVFNEIKFKGKTDSTMIYQTLNLGLGATIPVRVISVQVDDEILTVHLKRYSSTDQSGGAYGAFYGN